MTDDSPRLVLQISPPETWMLDETLSVVGIRVKIENGIVFLRPAGAGLTVDVLEAFFQPYSGLWQIEQPLPLVQHANHPLGQRILTRLRQLGLTRSLSYFPLHDALRGWHAVSLGPRSTRPPRGEPYLRAQELTTQPLCDHVTIEDVEAAVEGFV